MNFKILYLANPYRGIAHMRMLEKFAVQFCNKIRNRLREGVITLSVVIRTVKTCTI